MDESESDDGVLHAIGQLDPEIIAQLQPFRGNPDPGKDQLRDLPDIA